jgi:hypothetical protein
MPALDMTMEVKGPVFDRRGRDMVERAMEHAMNDLVEQSEAHISEMARPRPAPGVYLSRGEGGRSTGNYRRNISGKTQGLTGTLSDGGVVYGPWLEGTGSRNQTTRFKGYQMFRKTRQWAEEKSSEIANAHLRRATGKMSR